MSTMFMYSKRQEFCRCVLLYFQARAVLDGFGGLPCLILTLLPLLLHSSIAFFDRESKWLESLNPLSSCSSLGFSGRDQNGSEVFSQNLKGQRTSMIWYLLTTPASSTSSYHVLPYRAQPLYLHFLSTCISPTSVCLCKCCSCYSGWTALLFPIPISLDQEPTLFSYPVSPSQLVKHHFIDLCSPYYSPYHWSIFRPYFLIRVCDLFEDAASSKLF